MVKLNRNICRWCGAFIEGQEELREHEQIHRDLDLLDGIVNADEEPRNLDFAGSEVHESRNRDRDIPVPQTTNKHHCDKCSRKYQHKKHLNAHMRSVHDGVTYTCTNCKTIFKTKSDNTRHEKTCVGSEHVCPICQKRCASAYGLRRHLQWHDKQPAKRQSATSSSSALPTTSTAPSEESNIPASTRASSSLQYRCRRCTEVFDNRHDLYLHGMQRHYEQVGGALQPHPWGRHELPPWNRDNALREVYEANAPIILQNHRQGPIQSVYNFPLTNDVSMNQLMGYANRIYNNEQRAFRLNLVFGVILQNRETGQYRYFVPYNNNGVLERPLYISRRTDLERLRLQLQQKDLITELLRNRPDTKWIPVLVTNVHFTVYSTFHPLGNGTLPDFLLRKDSIYPLVKNRHNRKLYRDNLCAFRCLALHRGHDIKSIEGPAKEFYRQWSQDTVDTFEGLAMEDFPEFETCFQVNMEVYSLQEDGFARSIYKSRGQHGTTMYLNLYENHLSFIRDFKMYAQKYQCLTCDRHFKQPSDLHRHQRICSNKTHYVYPGGFHKAQDSIFDRLSDLGIDVPEQERLFPWFICYDLEAMLEKIHDQPTQFLEWSHKHVPISVSICSNVQGHTEPVCIVEPDQDRLVQHMVSTMTNIAEGVFELAEEKWGWVLEAIEKKIDKDDNEAWEIVNEGCEDVVLDETPEGEPDRKPRHPLCKVYGQMEAYMCQVPVLGFNSAKYDLNLIKRCLAKHLNMHENIDNFVIKKNNSYACISTDQLKFLDMSQFLAAGSSYAGFLKAYHVEEQKGYFPYEWLDQVDKLERTSLPPYDAFYSHLKGKNITVEEYQYCQKVWKDHAMTTFRDF